MWNNVRKLVLSSNPGNVSSRLNYLFKRTMASQPLQGRGGAPPGSMPSIPRYDDPAIEGLTKVLELARKNQACPEVVKGLEKVLHHVDLREEYTLNSTSQDSPVCQQVAKDTVNFQGWQDLKEQGVTDWVLWPRMLTGRLEGQFLKSLISAQRARRVLDVGMYTGYSALSMAEALPADGELITLDKEPYLKERNQAVFDSVPHGKKIVIKLGRAVDTMRELLKEGKQFDFIFLDADKAEYFDYMKLFLDEGLLAENGTIAMDNAYTFGRNYLPSEDPPMPSRIFGEYVMKEKRLHKVLLPLRDGVLLLRRLTEVERDMS